MILYRFNLLGYLYNILATSDKYVELKLRKLCMYTEHEFVQTMSKHDLTPQTSLIKPQALAFLKQCGTYKHLAVKTLGCTNTWLYKHLAVLATHSGNGSRVVILAWRPTEHMREPQRNLDQIAIICRSKPR